MVHDEQKEMKKNIISSHSTIFAAFMINNLHGPSRQQLSEMEQHSTDKDAFAVPRTSGQLRVVTLINKLLFQYSVKRKGLWLPKGCCQGKCRHGAIQQL